MHMFDVRRSDLEVYGQEREAPGRERATLARRLRTITFFYRYAEEEGLRARSPAAHSRRPRLGYESHAIGPDRNEVGAPLVAAGRGHAAEHALVSLLALNGPHVFEPIDADVESPDVGHGRRTLTPMGGDRGERCTSAVTPHGSCPPISPVRRADPVIWASVRPRAPGRQWR